MLIEKDSKQDAEFSFPINRREVAWFKLLMVRFFGEENISAFSTEGNYLPGYEDVSFFVRVGVREQLRVFRDLRAYTEACSAEFWEVLVSIMSILEMKWFEIPRTRLSQSLARQ